jgi:hypothetical protein
MSHFGMKEICQSECVLGHLVFMAVSFSWKTPSWVAHMYLHMLILWLLPQLEQDSNDFTCLELPKCTFFPRDGLVVQETMTLCASDGHQDHHT